MRGYKLITSTNDRAEVRWFNKPVAAREHSAWLDAEFGATLATAGGEDGAAGAGTHTKTETVNLRTAAVVRLESTL